MKPNILSCLLVNLIIILVINYKLNSQTLIPVLQWERFFDGQTGYNAGDAALFVDTDNSGNAYVSGYLKGDLTGNDLFIMKLNPQGDTTWTRKIIPDNFDNLPVSQTIDNAGNLYILANNLSIPLNFYKLIKLNSAGQLLWNKNFTKLQCGNNGVPVRCLEVDNLGNIYFTASTYSNNSDIAVYKVGPNGDSLWCSYLNGPGNKWDNATSLAVSDSGNVYACGTVWNGTSYDYATLKFDNSGNQKWVRYYDDNFHGTDYAYSVDVDNNGNVYVTGESYFAATSTRFATLKYNSQGVQQWVQFYTSDSLSDKGQIVKVLNQNEIYVAGTSYGGHYSTGGTGNDFCVVKYNASGQQQWVGRHNGQGNEDDYLQAITFDSYNNIILGGYTSDNIFWKNIAATCFSPSGSKSWYIDYDKDSNMQKAHSMAVTNGNMLYIAGESDYDFCVLKYDFVAGLKPYQDNGKYMIYPNPADDFIHIQLTDIPADGFVAEIFDVHGNNCMTRIIPAHELQTKKLCLSIECLKPGYYTGRLYNGGFFKSFCFVVCH